MLTQKIYELIKKYITEALIVLSVIAFIQQIVENGLCVENMIMLYICFGGAIIGTRLVISIIDNTKEE